MLIDGATIPDLIRLTLREPRAAAARILNTDHDSTVLWQVLLLVVVISTILAQITVLFGGGSEALQSDPMMPSIFANPMTLGFIQGCMLVLVVFAVHWIGRMFGGTGAFEGSIALVSWLQFLLTLLQVVQLVLVFLLPSLTSLVVIGGMILFFWLLTQFICELHGFEQPALVVVGIILSVIALTFGLSILLAIVGLIFGMEAAYV